LIRLPRPPRTSIPAREQGFALLIVLWSVVFLSVLVSRITSSGRTEIQLASNMREAAVAENAADGAIYQTLFHLLAADQQHWAASGIYRIAIGATVVHISIDNLSGRVNPNTATPELMRELLVALGSNSSEATALAEAIVTWRTSRRQPERPFTDIDELGAIPGMTPALLGELRPRLTLWWENDPDPAFADPVVLRAMQALGDTRPRTGSVKRPIQVVSVVTLAVTPGGGRFVRHADAIVNTAAPRLRWRILAWDRQDEPL